MERVEDVDHDETVAHRRTPGYRPAMPRRGDPARGIAPRNRRGLRPALGWSPLAGEYAPVYVPTAQLGQRLLQFALPAALHTSPGDSALA
jgi:hypothetical protein